MCECVDSTFLSINQIQNILDSKVLFLTNIPIRALLQVFSQIESNRSLSMNETLDTCNKQTNLVEQLGHKCRKIGVARSSSPFFSFICPE